MLKHIKNYQNDLSIHTNWSRFKFDIHLRFIAPCYLINLFTFRHILPKVKLCWLSPSSLLAFYFSASRSYWCVSNISQKLHRSCDMSGFPESSEAGRLSCMKTGRIDINGSLASSWASTCLCLPLHCHRYRTLFPLHLAGATLIDLTQSVRWSAAVCWAR